MRRNRNIGRGGGRGGTGLNMSGGPLLTEHLKDIDLELELLKRKREMIEQQQNQFIQPFNAQQQPRNFNQQPYFRVQNEHGGDSNLDFSHLYNDGPQYYRRPFGKKRQSDSGWQHDSFPKRSAGSGPRGPSYAGPSVQAQRPYSDPTYQPKPFKYAQAKQFMSQKAGNQKSQKSNKNFVPNKVTKPNKLAAPPNKLASQPVTARNELVAAAIKSVAEVEHREREAMRLLPDKVPTKQMTGRLELALGAILRNIREKCAETDHDETLRSTALQRLMKQAIRERIRTAMLGKIVGATTDIIQEYRNMFPKETDIGIVNLALEAACLAPEKPATAIEKERPDDFYKENMFKLIDLHLQQMLDKIDEIYNPPESEGEVDLTENVELTATANGTDEESTKPEEAANTEEGNKSVEAGENKTAESVETDKAANGEGADKTANGGEADKTANDEEADKTTNSGEADKTAKSGEADKSTVLQPVANNPAKQINIQKSIDDLAAKLTNANPDDYKRMLPRMLKKHIPMIQKLLHVNKMYRAAVADLTSATRAKYVEYGKSIKNQANEEPKNVAEAPATKPPAQASKFVPPPVLPYYVKVMGKPQLPKKKVMKAFLDIFHPKSIKKHRSIHNLLFIGFVEKSDFEAILQADGTAFGRSTLSIRACDKAPNKPEENANVSTVNDADQTADSGHDNSDIIGSDLDGQITDLLISIRNNEDVKAQEEKSEENGIADNGETTSVEKIQDNTNEIDNDETNEGADNEKAESNGNADVEKTEVNNEPPKTPTKNEAKTENKDTKAENDDATKAENDTVAELKTAPSGRSTPVRASSRLANAPATPSSIRTRRASRLMQ